MVEHSLGEDTLSLSHTHTHTHTHTSRKTEMESNKDKLQIANNVFGYISGSQEPSVQMRWQWMP